MASSRIASMWDEAVLSYEQTTKLKFRDLPRPESAQDLIQQVQKANLEFEGFRRQWSGLYKTLSAIAKPIELVGNLAAGAASAAFPPSSMIFGAAMYLIRAAHGVSEELDAISLLMAKLQDFSTRLNIYDRTDLSDELREKLTEILASVTVIMILASFTHKLEHRGFRGKEYLKNVARGNSSEMKNLYEKLDRLTQSENLLVGAETHAEVMSIGKGVQVVQATMDAMHASFDMNSQGIADIKAALDDKRAQSQEERSQLQFEALKRVLKPSATAQEKIEQIKRERRLVPLSGDWILSEENFSHWVTRKQWPLLWIAGNPGSGKSFLTYNILNCLHEHSRHESNSGMFDTNVGIFFFQDNSVVTQSFRQALCDVAYQLALNDPAYFKYLNAIGLSEADISSIGRAWKVLFKDYWLSDRTFNSAYIVLDGLDEASPQDREIFFGLLKDVEDLGATSKLWVAMLGRPHVVEEMSLGELRVPPTVYVDATKNGADITLYVQSSIAKSQALKRISPKLKAKIIQTLTAKAGGMFMWAKLMITELSRKAQRSREAEVEKVLNEAPKGLTEMIRHVLEGFSVSLSPDEADDLNTMLTWVSLAQRPLCLGELDAALRLKSEDGGSVVYLEGMLRKTYASLFTLSREDGLTTSELLTSDDSTGYDEFDDSESRNIPGGGEDDLDYPIEFSSSPSTTIVSFSHASISDYFADPKNSKVVSLKDEACVVGVDLDDAHFTISKACIDMITDEAYRNRMGDAISLLNYATKNWHLHLEHTKCESLDEEARYEMGMKLVHILRDEKLLKIWAGTWEAQFFTSTIADSLILWLTDLIPHSRLHSDAAEWLGSLDKENPVEIFQQAMQYIANQWLGTSDGNWNMKICPYVIHCWLTRRKDKTIDNIPISSLTVDNILEAAQFGRFEETAEFYRRLGVSLREYDHYEAAQERFEKALERDPDLWLATAGNAYVYFKRQDYQQAINMYESLISSIDTSLQEPSAHTLMHASTSHQRLADCYSGLRNEITELPSETALELDVKACQHYYKAFQKNKSNYSNASSCLQYWQLWSDDNFLQSPQSIYTNSGDIPTPDRCFKEIMGLAHELDDFHNDQPTHWLWSVVQIGQRDEDIFAWAASKTDELWWLHECYSQGALEARKALKPVIRAEMVLNLGIFCDMYMDEDEKALGLFESLVSERVLSIREETEITLVKIRALDRLSRFCVRRAIEDESQSERYIGKLEKIRARIRRDATALSEDAVLLFSCSLLLVVWYAKKGWHEKVVEAIRAPLKHAFALLSDDDPTNDMEGYYKLTIALAAARDDQNMIAVSHLVRRFRDGVAVLASDLDVGDDKNQNSNQNAAETAEKMTDNDYRNMIEAGQLCNGGCPGGVTSLDNTFTCRYDLTNLCAKCYALLHVEGSYRDFKCSTSHEFLEIAPLTTRFKQGEIVMDGVVMDLDVWKQGVKEKWGLA